MENTQEKACAQMASFTDRQLLLALHSIHERGMRIFNFWKYSLQITSKKPDGTSFTKEDSEQIHAGYTEHMDLVEIIQKLRDQKKTISTH